MSNSVANSTAVDSRRALIFDFDGVLVDAERAHFDCWNQAFEQIMGIRLDSDYRVLVGTTLEDIYRLWTPQELDPELKQRLLARKTELFFAPGASHLVPMPGSVELIRRAHVEGWYVAIASRALRRRLHRTLAVMQMPSLFDVILGGEDAVNPATNRKDHARAAHIFGIDPSACIVIEDSASGIADARASGIGQVIGFTSSLTADTLYAAGAHLVVDHLTDVQLTVRVAAE
jgi:beta-phosphoglucomutase-like phosphatase (HAD superfamily)